MFDLGKKTALVTGSSRGIGKAIAFGLSDAGASVILHGRRDSEALNDTYRELLQKSRSVYKITADTSEPDEIKNMFDEIEKSFGYVDIMVNNAAVLTRNPFLELKIEEWDRLMNTNVRGYFLCGQSAARLMKENGVNGRIINISSISQFIAAEGRTHYCASKGAIGMLTKGMALELGPYGITANAVLPGSIHTDFNDDVLSDESFYKKCVDGIPLGRIGSPQDIVPAVVMLASDEASYITGAEIVVDGAKTVF